MMTENIPTEVLAAAAPRRAAPSFAIHAARSAVQWRLLALWTAVLLVPTALAAFPFWRLLAANLNHSVHAAELAQRLDLVALSDLGAEFGRSGAAVTYGSVLALIVTLLLSPLLCGMTASAARAKQTPGFADLLAGGIQEYPRMLRMLAWALVPMGAAAGLALIAFSAAHKYGETAVLASQAENASRAAMCIAVLLLAFAGATLDAGRAVLAADRRRKSAVSAWWQGLKLVKRKPLATFGVYLAISAVGLLLGAALAVARLNVPPLGFGGFVAAFALTQLAVAAVAWMRCARLFAMVELARTRQA
jgi:hypothetical protein